MRIFQDFLSLFFPVNCAGCHGVLNGNEKIVCSNCYLHLPLTHDHLSKEANSIEKLFWGRTNIQFGSAYLFFTKGSITQQILHALKYKGQEDIGIFMGQLYGASLSKSENFMSIDAIIPVPLHVSKLRKRGYNQSERIALGLSEKLKKPILTNVLVKKGATSTQTKKNRFNRWQNVEEKFQIQNQKLIEGKHILLVDDVITTGATIDACAGVLLSANNVKVSVVALAVAISNC